MGILILSVAGYAIVRRVPTWADDRIEETLRDKGLTESLPKDIVGNAISTCTHKHVHVGMVMGTGIRLFPAEPVFEVMLRPYSGIPGTVASVSVLLLLVVLFVLWMAEVVARLAPKAT
jgi:hypothetical protein